MLEELAESNAPRVGQLVKPFNRFRCCLDIELPITAGSVPPPRRTLLFCLYFGNAVGMGFQLPSEFGGAHVERFKLFGKMFFRMNCAACHVISLMIVQDLDVIRASCAFRP